MVKIDVRINLTAIMIITLTERNLLLPLRIRKKKIKFKQKLSLCSRNHLKVLEAEAIANYYYYAIELIAQSNCIRIWSHDIFPFLLCDFAGRFVPV